LRKYVGPLFLFWTGVLIVTYYVVQKPNLLSALAGWGDTLWMLLVAVILLFNAYAIGKRVLHLLRFEGQDSIDHLLFSFGIGLGFLGLLGLFFSVIQLANENILTFVQISLGLFFLLRNDFRNLRADLSTLASGLNRSFSQYGLFTKLAILLPLTFSFLLTFVPPFEAFDALLYHLSLPARILQHGGLQAFDIVPFWFPSLSENVYLWALGMGSERAPQVLHFAWMLCSALLLWHWASRTWSIEVGRKALLLIATMPSVPMLASWAYADMALVFYAIASIYAFTQYRSSKASSWLAIMGVMAGFAMGIKYTSFTVPLACGLLLLFDRPWSRTIAAAARFSFIALIMAAPWYIRNVVFMGNPFYPFVFGGRYWDSFLASWYAESGTGIGWNALQLILLPLNTMLGTHDVTFFDGRIGPVFLILAPFTIWILIWRARQSSAEGWSLLAIGIFSLISFSAWTIGVINSVGLWQARLLLPALIPFAIPTALAWDSLRQFDTSKLHISSLVNALIAIVIVLNVIDTALFVVQRNPLAVAFGAQSRERYIERVNTSYAALMKLMDELPEDAYVYSLLEPRSYGLPRLTQPDPLNYNFAHDVYLYKGPEKIVQHWKAEQYTHVIVYERGLALASGSSKFPPEVQALLQETLNELHLVGQTPDKIYSIYRIP
jgi:hypothetical protein